MQTALYDKIVQIEIETHALTESLFAGAWRSTFKGQGMEFDELREYQTGDEIRTIDWKVTARMNHPYVKVFREERELTVILLVDISPSMQFAHKRELLAQVGGLFSFSAIKNNDRIGLTLFTDQIEKYIPPAKGTRHVLHIIRQLLAFHPKGKQTNLKKAVLHIGRSQKRRAVCFLLSDFLAPLPLRELKILAKHHDLIAIRIASPFERVFPYSGKLRTRDLETGKEKTIRMGDPAQSQNVIEDICHKIGAGFLHLDVGDAYADSMRHFFLKRAKPS